jgi:hypothetical protein
MMVIMKSRSIKGLCDLLFGKRRCFCRGSIRGIVIVCDEDGEWQCHKLWKIDQ